MVPRPCSTEHSKIARGKESAQPFPALFSPKRHFTVLYEEHFSLKKRMVMVDLNPRHRWMVKLSNIVLVSVSMSSLGSAGYLTSGELTEMSKRSGFPPSHTGSAAWITGRKLLRSGWGVDGLGDIQERNMGLIRASACGFTSCFFPLIPLQL